jgi:hypothetical protein
MDSTNIIHLNKENDIVPEVIMDRVKARVKLGLKVADKFTIEMTIQGYYDLRAFLAKLEHIISTP